MYLTSWWMTASRWGASPRGNPLHTCSLWLPQVRRSQPEPSRWTLLFSSELIQWKPNPHLGVHALGQTRNPGSSFLMSVVQPEHSTASRFIPVIVVINANYCRHGDVQDKLHRLFRSRKWKSCLCCSSFALHGAGTGCEFHVFVPFASQPSWPEEKGKWEISKQISSASVSVSLIASDHNQKGLPCHLRGSFLLGIFTSTIHVLLRLQRKHRSGARGTVLEVK